MFKKVAFSFSVGGTRKNINRTNLINIMELVEGKINGNR
jgi:hypothetical protein